jgi:hypothetical protein
MPTRYGDVYVEGSTATVTALAPDPGRTAANFQRIATLPASTMPTGARSYAIFVRGMLHNIRNATATPAWTRGMAEICLGTTAGLVASQDLVQIMLEPAVGPQTSIPFELMLVTDAANEWGATLSISSSLQICLYARIDRNRDTDAGQQYSYQVSDVQWLWLDRTAIPAGDIVVQSPTPGTEAPLSGGLPGLTSTPFVCTFPTQAGTASQKWLHFLHWRYQPALGNGTTTIPTAPRFSAGQYLPSTTTYDYKVGTGPDATQPRLGLARNFPSNLGNIRIRPIMRQTAWWYQQNPASGTWFPTFRAVQPAPYVGTGQALAQVVVERSIALRLDLLDDVLARTETSWPAVTGNRFQTTPAEGAAYLALERSATGSPTLPIVMARGIVQTRGTQDYCLEIYSNTGTPISTTNVHARSDLTAGEGVLLSTMSRIGLAGTTQAIQYRTRWTGGVLADQESIAVRDVQILQLNLVAGVDPDPTLPAVPSYLTLTPGRESANPATLLPLPIACDAEQSEDATVATEAIAGSTGYVRTWPLFATVRRQFSLQWSALSGANATTLAAFLTANPAFRFRPHREGADIAVVQLDAPNVEQVSGHVYAIGVRVAELIWTD